MKDRNGTEISVRDEVVYATVDYKRPVMRSGVIRKIAIGRRDRVYAVVRWPDGGQGFVFRGSNVLVTKKAG